MIGLPVLICSHPSSLMISVPDACVFPQYTGQVASSNKSINDIFRKTMGNIGK